MTFDRIIASSSHHHHIILTGSNVKTSVLHTLTLHVACVKPRADIFAGRACALFETSRTNWARNVDMGKRQRIQSGSRRPQDVRVPSHGSSGANSTSKVRARV